MFGLLAIVEMLFLSRIPNPRLLRKSHPGMKAFVAYIGDKSNECQSVTGALASDPSVPSEPSDPIVPREPSVPSVPSVPSDPA